MKVLLAVDGSDAANAVTQEVAARPWPKGSEFWLLSALDPFFFTRAPNRWRCMHIARGK